LDKESPLLTVYLVLWLFDEISEDKLASNKVPFSFNDFSFVAFLLLTVSLFFTSI